MAYGNKNVGSAAMNLAVNERAESGDYSSADDFARRLSQDQLTKILESLTKAGAFDFSGEERASIFSRVDRSFLRPLLHTKIEFQVKLLYLMRTLITVLVKLASTTTLLLILSLGVRMRFWLLSVNC